MVVVILDSPGYVCPFWFITSILFKNLSFNIFSHFRPSNQFSLFLNWNIPISSSLFNLLMTRQAGAPYNYGGGYPPGAGQMHMRGGPMFPQYAPSKYYSIDVECVATGTWTFSLRWDSLHVPFYTLKCISQIATCIACLTLHRAWA